MISYVRKLAGEIDPRGTGTHGEGAAADYVDDHLADLGLPVERQMFRAESSKNDFAMAINLMALLVEVDSRMTNNL